MLLALAPGVALDGEPGMHNPSTVIEAARKFYVYATGPVLLSLRAQHPMVLGRRPDENVSV